MERDVTATTSFMSGVAISSHSSLQDHTFEAEESDSDSAVSHTKTPELWKLTPLPSIQSSRSPTPDERPSLHSVSDNNSPDSRSSSSENDQSSEGSPAIEEKDRLESSPTYTVLSPVIVTAPQTPRDTTVVISKSSSQQSVSSTSSKGSRTSSAASSASGSAAPSSHSSRHSPASPAYSEVFARTPTVYYSRESTENEESKSTLVPSPLFIKCSPQITIRSPSERVNRHRMARENTAPGGLEREPVAFQPLPPPSPSPGPLSARSATQASPTGHRPLPSFAVLGRSATKWRKDVFIPGNRYLVI